MNSPIDFGSQMVYDYMNMQPSMVKTKGSEDLEVNKRFLWNKIYSRFKFTLPEEWKLNWFRFWLFQYGSIAIADTNKFGWICYPYSIESWDLYYNPKKVNLNCVQLEPSDTEKEVGVNCYIAHILDDYYGLDDLVTHYASQLSQCDKDIQINLMNANVSYIFNAKNKKQAEQMKTAYTKATIGEPFIAINNEDFNENEGLTTMLNSPKNNYIVNDLLDSRRTILNEFLTEIGINNANTDKKERLVSDEVKANNEEVKSLIEIMYENIKNTFEAVNKASGLNLNVELNTIIDEEVPDNVSYNI